VRVLIALALFLAVGSCGPSTRDIALAKTARYNADKLRIFQLTKWVTERKYQIYQSDETALTIYTKARWHTPEGLGSQWSDPGDVIGVGNNINFVTQRGRPAIRDQSLLIAMIIRILPEAKNWVVYIETKIWRYNVGMPNLEPVDPKRIDLPGWATGKANQLQYEIYNVLKKYQVKNVQPLTDDPTPPKPTEPITPAEPHPVDVPGINSHEDAGSGSGSGSAGPGVP
jgi:hypothetical protein